MTVCACLGPQDGNPVCSCRMKTGYYEQPWVRFPAVENTAPLVTKLTNGNNYYVPIKLQLLTKKNGKS